MRFPEQSHEGGGAHIDAQRRLADAQHRHRELTEAHASASPADRLAAIRRVDEANTDVQAREAWLSWVELGV